MEPAVSPTDQQVLQMLWMEINQGWLVVKLLELILIPYSYVLLRPNHIIYWLNCAALINIPHNLFGFLAMHFKFIYPEVLVKY